MTGDDVREWIGEELGGGSGWVQVRVEVKMGGGAVDVAAHEALNVSSEWHNFLITNGLDLSQSLQHLKENLKENGTFTR